MAIYLTLFGIWLVTFVLLYLYFTRNNNHWKNKNIHFLKPVPFFGNVLNAILMRQSIAEIFRDAYNKTNRAFVGMFILDKPCLLLRDPKLIRQILITDFQYFCDRNALSNPRDDPISASILFIVKNPEWKEIRAKVTPTFSSLKIKAMLPLLMDSSNELVDYLIRLASHNSVVNVHRACEKFTLDVISSAAFGIKANCFEKRRSDFETASKNLTNWKSFWRTFQMRCYFLAPSLAIFFRMSFFDRTAEEFLKSTFLTVMKSRADVSAKSRNDLIDILLQLQDSGDRYKETDHLVSQAVMFLVAGFDTSSIVLTYALYELAIHQEVQVKLRDEINSVVQKHGIISYDAIEEMGYLKMCVKEALRKYPSLPFLDRACMADYEIPDSGVVIDKGTPVFIPTLGLHYDPEYYPDPEVFDPERFSPTSSQNNIFFSFGDGPRNCIGARFGYLTVYLGLISILQHFDLSVCQETQKKIKYEPKSVTLTPAKGLYLRLKERK